MVSVLRRGSSAIGGWVFSESVRSKAHLISVKRAQHLGISAKDERCEN
jgi:hypothetical protein